MSEALRIEERAADWLARQDGGPWTEADQAALEAWLEEATANRVAWLRLKAAWNRAERLAALNAPPAPQVQDSAGPFDRAPRRSLVSRRLAASLAGLLIMAGGIGLALGLHPAGPKAYETEVGGRETVPLADGSRVELNTATRLRARVSHDRRTVWLDRGEAYFEVAHDRAHPFVVYAGSRKVTVLGTRFSVRRDGEQVEVTVAEGRVRVDPLTPSPAAKPEVLTRGEIALARPDATVVADKGAQEVANALSWRQGVIVFDQSTLADAAHEFNRYNSRKLVIADAAVGQRRIGGSFATDNVAGFARVLQQIFGLKVEDKGDQIVISS
jgi:transmembrane sensor